MTKFVSFAVVSWLTVPGLACASHAVDPPLAQQAPTRVGVAVAHEETLRTTFRVSGTVRGKNTAVLTSRTTGYVRAVHVRSGDAVTQGQLLAELEANDVRAAVARSRAALGQALAARTEAASAIEAARATAAVARSTQERSVTLLTKQAISQQQFDDDDARFRSAVASEEMARARERQVTLGIEEAKASLAEAQATLGYAKIVAPFSGRVLERRIDPGALASPGTPLLVLADEGVVRIEAPVPESRAADVAVGNDVTVEVGSTDKPLTGKVGEIVPSVDVASRAFLSKIDLPAGTEQLRPGTYVRVSFPTGAQRALVVPTTAISSFGAIDRVFVVEGNAARLRMIARGESQGLFTRVLSGLSPNETVVAVPPSELRDGSLVEIVR
ncbi:MAG TPA: efflux RND transporter periplasmic adaptor subunit [Polyangiaceae bacterium]